MPQLHDAHHQTDDHDHPHAEISHSGRPGYYEIMETAVRRQIEPERRPWVARSSPAPG
jgi:hypothetical protein